jgi:hypothetical protein
MSETTERWGAPAVEAAVSMFQEAWADAARRQGMVADDRRKREALALVEEARLVLIRTALLELAEAQRPELFAAALPYGFGTEAVLTLKRHGVPYRGLLAITGGEGLSAEPTDPYFLAVQGQPVEWLRRTREALKQQGSDLLGRYAAFRDARAQASAGAAAPADIERRWFPVPVVVPEQARPSAVLLDARRRGRAFRVLGPEEARSFQNSVPLYDLAIAAGRFSGEQQVDHEPSQWVELTGRTRPARDLFVARVVGESMNRRIPYGAYCLFRARPQGSRDGRVVLAQHREISDGETGGHYTVKVYWSEKERLSDGTWRHRRIVLKPDSTDPSFEPIVLENIAESDIQIIAELVEVLG